MRFLLSLCLLASCYTLSAQLVGETQNGLASYYSNEYQGAETAYGEIYDRNELVAAHRLYPFNSVVKVRNVENGKSVNVRIIDKGPFIRGRIIELSERAAANLNMLGKETVQVELTLLSTPDQPAVAAAQPVQVVTPEPTTPEPAPVQADRAVVIEQPVSPAPTTSPAPAPAPVKPKPVTKTSSQATRPAPTVSSAAATVKATAVSTAKVERAESFAPGIYKIELTKPKGGDFGVQVGSFGDLESAMDKVTELQGKWFDNIMIERVKIGPASTYKVVLGPFDQQKSASRYASDLKKRYKIDGFTVNISGK